MITPVPLQPDIQLTLDAAGVIRDATLSNDMAGEPVDALLGRLWLETLDEVEVVRVGNLVERAVASGVSPFFQVSQHLPSGLVVPVEYMTVRSGDGLVAIGKDVRSVARMQSSMAVSSQAAERNHWKWREVETRQQAFFEAARDAMLVVEGEDLRIVLANPAALAALGSGAADDEELSHARLLDLVVPDDRELLKTTLELALDQGRAPGIVVHLGPTRAPWLVKTSLMFGSDGGQVLVQLLGFEEPLAPSVQPPQPLSLADHIEVLPDGFVVMDADGVIVEANRAFLEMVQEGADGTIKGQHVGRWLGRPGGDEKMFLSSLRANGRVQRFPASIAGSRGGRVDAEITAVINVNGARGSIWACVHDVSRRLDGAGQPAGQHAQLGALLMSLMEQVGKTGLKSLVNMAVGLVERYYITQALQLTAGNRTAAARLLGLSRQSLYVKLARYGIEGADGSEGLDAPRQAEP